MTTKDEPPIREAGVMNADVTSNVSLECSECERLQQALWKCQEERDTMMTVTDRDWTRTLLRQNDELDQLRAEVQRLKNLETWYTEAIDALHTDLDEARAEVTTLEWQLSEATKEIKRLREVLARLVQLGTDDEHEPEDAWTVAWGHAEALLKNVPL